MRLSDNAARRLGPAVCLQSVEDYFWCLKNGNPHEKTKSDLKLSALDAFFMSKLGGALFGAFDIDSSRVPELLREAYDSGEYKFRLQDIRDHKHAEALMLRYSDANSMPCVR